MAFLKVSVAALWVGVSVASQAVAPVPSCLNRVKTVESQRLAALVVELRGLSAQTPADADLSRFQAAVRARIRKVQPLTREGVQALLAKEYMSMTGPGPERAEADAEAACQSAAEALNATPSLEDVLVEHLALTADEWKLDRLLRDPVFARDPRDPRRTYAVRGFVSFRGPALAHVKRGEAPRQGLTDAELVALYAYTSSHYRGLNHYLRHPKQDPAVLGTVEAFARYVRQALSKLPRCPEGAELYRNTSLDEDVVREYDAQAALPDGQGRITDGGFISTSAPGAGLNFASGRYHFSIVSPSARDISKYSAFYGEGECLVPAGLTFAIRKMSSNVYYLTEAPPRPEPADASRTPAAKRHAPKRKN